MGHVRTGTVAYSAVCMLYGGHPGGRRTPVGGGRADTPADGRRAAGGRTPPPAGGGQADAPVGAMLQGGTVYHISHRHSRSTPGVFYTCFYNHAHRIRLEKLLYLELSRSPSGFFKALLWIQVAVSLLKPPHGGFRRETAVTKPFRK
jgi:hypothetical protein